MASLQLSIGLGDILQTAKAIDMKQIGTKGCMKNETKTTMMYSSSHDWDGTPMCYPPSIAAHSSVQFIHNADPCKGSKEGVVYFGTNNQCMPCAWLMAWYAPNNPCAQTPNKVYVECGPKEKYEHVDWCKIEKKLDASSNHSSYEDKCTGTTAEATIDDCCQFASVAARFGDHCPCN